jgi:hypothetical protein
VEFKIADHRPTPDSEPTGVRPLQLLPADLERERFDLAAKQFSRCQADEGRLAIELIRFAGE